MRQTQTSDLPELVAKGVASDARRVAHELAELEDVPAILQVRVRAIQLELSEALIDALTSSPEVAQGVRPLVEPVRDLTETVKQYEQSGAMDRDRTRLALLGVAQALDYFTDLQLDATPAQAVEWILENTAWTQKQLSDALSVDDRTVQRWLNDNPVGTEAEARIRALHRIALPLRYAMSARGVGQWLSRPLRLFDDRSPVELLHDEAAVDELVRVANALRG